MPATLSRSFVILALVLAGTSEKASAQELADIAALFDEMDAAGKTGLAAKTHPVDARPTDPGEIIVTTLAGETETTSPPAQLGDMVVRNRCDATGNEEILVTAAKFAERYDGPLSTDGQDGWAEYRPRGNEMAYFIVPPDQAPFSFVAPWGERMPAVPGDSIVQDPADPGDTYRIAKAAFACTYTILKAPAE